MTNFERRLNGAFLAINSMPQQLQETPSRGRLETTLKLLLRLAKPPRTATVGFRCCSHSRQDANLDGSRIEIELELKMRTCRQAGCPRNAVGCIGNNLGECCAPLAQPCQHDCDLDAFFLFLLPGPSLRK